MGVLTKARHRAGVGAAKHADLKAAGAAGLEDDVLIVAGTLDIDNAVADPGDAAAGDNRTTDNIDEAVSTACEQRPGIGHGAAHDRRAAGGRFHQSTRGDRFHPQFNAA